MFQVDTPMTELKLLLMGFQDLNSQRIDSTGHLVMPLNCVMQKFSVEMFLRGSLTGNTYQNNFYLYNVALGNGNFY